MSRFAELNKNIGSVVATLLSSQNLCKYLYYTNDTPLTQPDITDTKVLLFKNIYPTPIIPQVQDEVKSLLTIVLDGFALNRTNSAVKSSKIIFNLLTHIDIWPMTGTGLLRPYAILNEIDELFNGSRIVGIGRTFFESGNWISVNDKFQGYRLVYKIDDLN